jgi:hypothetical protein
MQRLLGHAKIESAIRDLRIEVDDAVAIGNRWWTWHL